MPPVQLSRLRCQISAVALKFADSDEFCRSVTALFGIYGSPEALSIRWGAEESAIKTIGVPAAVMVETESRFSLLAKENPAAAIKNADCLWKTDIYEVRKMGITMLANLDALHEDLVIDRVHRWIQPDLDSRLVKDLLEAFGSDPEILRNPDWVNSLSNWLNSPSEEMRRLGLKAVSRTILMDYENLPQIFNMLSPVFKEPHISIQKDLFEVLRALISRSEAETASFLIMLGALQQDQDVNAFIRKSLSLFDPYFQDEIKTALNS